MSKLGWFVAGAALGALTVIQLRDNPKAQAALDEAITAAKDFGAAVAAGYQEREAEIATVSAPKTPSVKPKTAAKPAPKK